MTQTHQETSIKPPPLIMARSLPAPRAQVFQAWSTAEHMKRWFSPECFTVPEAVVDFRPGGACDICMRSPEGQEFWSRGKYVEIVPIERLVFATGMSIGEEPKFSALTTVTFEDEGGGTRMVVNQAYEVFDAAFMAAIDGAPEGWRTTLDKLEMEVARIKQEGG